MSHCERSYMVNSTIWPNSKTMYMLTLEIYAPISRTSYLLKYQRISNEEKSHIYNATKVNTPDPHIKPTYKSISNRDTSQNANQKTSTSKSIPRRNKSRQKDLESQNSTRSKKDSSTRTTTRPRFKIQKRESRPTTKLPSQEKNASTPDTLSPRQTATKDPQHQQEKDSKSLRTQHCLPFLPPPSPPPEEAQSIRRLAWHLESRQCSKVPREWWCMTASAWKRYCHFCIALLGRGRRRTFHLSSLEGEKREKWWEQENSA